MLVEHPWVGWTNAIVTQFLLLVGVSLTLLTSIQAGAGDFWKRWAQVAAAALLVSAGSALVFGNRFIWFGILHFVAAALVLVRPLVRLGRWNWLLGFAALAVGLLYANAAFDEPPMWVIGFMTGKPRTEDYVPLFPWLGVVLIGVALGVEWQKRGWNVPAALRHLNDAPPRGPGYRDRLPIGRCRWSFLTALVRFHRPPSLQDWRSLTLPVETKRVASLEVEIRNSIV